MNYICSQLRKAALFSVLAVLACAPTFAQTGCTSNINLLPKYGERQKCQDLVDVDDRYLAAMDKQYSGDRRKASSSTSSRGWQYFMEGNLDDAMRRFNQAWLLDASNGFALWGMGAVLFNKKEYREALKLFSEANAFLAANPRFQVDYARALGLGGTALKDRTLVNEALMRFSSIYTENPENTINLQNWAMTLYFLEKYDEAWEKIRIAQSKPDAKLLSKAFVDDLRQKVGGAK